MNKKDFDKKLKQDLDSYQSPINIDEIWSAIEPDIDLINAKKRRKKRFFFIWFLAGLFLLGSVGYMYSLYQSGSSNPIVSQDSEKEISRTSAKKTAIAIDAKKKEQINASEAAVLPKASPLNSKKENKSAQLFNKQEDVKQEIKKTRTKTLSNSSNQGTQKNIDSPIVKKVPTVNITKESKSTPPSTINDDNLIVLQTKEIVDKIEASEILQTTENSQARELEKVSMFSFLEAIAMEASANTEIPNWENLIELTPEEKEEIVKKKRSSSAKKIHYFATINGGVSESFRSLKDPAGNNPTLLQNRKEYEHTLEAIHGGFQIGIQSQKSGLEFSTGIQYTKITDYLEVNDSRSVFDTIPEGIQFYYRNLDGETIPYYGEVINEQIITRRKKTYNEFVFIDIPLLVGIQKNVGKKEKINIGAQAGVFVNLSLSASGEIINKDLGVEDLGPSFNSKMGISYYLGLTSSYALDQKNKLSLQVSPSFRYIPKSLTIESYGLTQKYSLLGLNVGLRLKL